MMSETPKDRHEEQSAALPDRRKFLAVGAGVTAATLLSCNTRSDAAPGAQAAAGATTAAGNAPQNTPRPGRRRLGKLEVSEIGMADAAGRGGTSSFFDHRDPAMVKWLSEAQRET
jgi:hypothetical protein